LLRQECLSRRIRVPVDLGREQATTAFTISVSHISTTEPVFIWIKLGLDQEDVCDATKTVRKNIFFRDETNNPAPFRISYLAQYKRRL